MSDWTIYTKEGLVRHESLTGYNADGKAVRQDTLEYSGKWMGECFLTVSIKSAYPIDFQIGDYIDYRGERFTINYDPTVIKKARRGTYGEGFTYDSIKFNSLSNELTEMMFHDWVLSDNRLHYTSLPNFSFYCKDVDDLVDRLQANTDRWCKANGYPLEDYWMFYTLKNNTTSGTEDKGQTQTLWERTAQRARDVLASVGVASTDAAYDTYINAVTAKWKEVYGEGDNYKDSRDDERYDRNVSASTQTVWDMMTAIKQQFGLNFIIRGRNVYVGTAGIPTSHLFKYGKGNGLYEVDKTADQDQKVVTKLHAYGSNENLPSLYYARLNAQPYATIVDIEHLTVPTTTQVFAYVALDMPYSPQYFSVPIGARGYAVRVGIGDYVSTYDENPTNYGGSYALLCKDIGSVFMRTNEGRTLLSLCFNFGSYDENEGATAEQIKAAIVVGARVNFLRGMKTAAWPTDHLNYNTDNLPDNMAVNFLMLPGFPNNSLADVCRSEYDSEKDVTNYYIKQPDDKGSVANSQEILFHTEGGKHVVAFSSDQYDPYLLSPNAASSGVKEGDIFCNEENDDNGLEKVYPTVEEVTNADAGITSGKSTDRVDVVVGAEKIKDNGVWPQNKQTEISGFHIYLPDLGFNLRQAAQDAGGSEMKIAMKNGFCGGRTFDVAQAKEIQSTSEIRKTYPRAAWDLSCKRSIDNDLDIYFPYSYAASVKDVDETMTDAYQIVAGDNYVLTGISVDDVNYVWAASVKLLRKAIHWLCKNDYTRYVYSPKIDEIYMAREAQQAVANGLTPLHDTLKEGDMLLFSDDDLLINGSVYIDQLTIKENGNNGIPTYDVTLRNEVTVGSLQRMQNTVDSLKTDIKNGTLAPSGSITPTQLDPLIKAYGENYFLSKLHDDTAAGSITVNGDHSVGGSQTVMGSQEVGEGQTVGGTQNVAGLSSLLGGLTVGGKYGIDADGVATLAKAVVQVLKTAGYTDPSMTGAGAAMYEDEDRGFTVTDYLTVRIKAIFNELEIRRLSYVGGNYVFSHAGSRIITQAELDAAGLTGLKPVNEIKDGDTVTGWKVYFKADDGTTRTQNMWRVGDQALCQTFNIDKDSHENASNRYYWRLVTAAGSETVDGAETALDYVVLSNQATISGALTDGTDKFYPVGGDTSDDSSAKNLWQGYDDLSGTDTYRSGASIKGKLDITAPDTPAEGDTLVQVGCQADTRVLSTGATDGGICKERGGVVEIVTEGMGGEPCPAINIYSAINGYTWQAHKVMQMSADGMVGVAKYFSLRTDSLAGEPMALFNYRGEWSSDVAYSYGDCVVKDGQSWVWSDRAKSASASDIPGSSDGWHIASKQGNGGYSVWLSRYSSVLTVDDLGNPIGGIYTMSKDGVKQWRIATAIFARKGSDLLLVKGDGDPDEGHYTVAAWGDGCDIALDHSTVYVTKIHNMHDSNEQTTEAFDYDKMRRTNFCRVTITVCCEGKSTYTMEFPIRIAHDSLPFMLCDLSNQSLHVGWNTKETAYYGFPATTDVSVLYHNEPWAINSCTVDGVPAGLKAVVSDATDGKGKTITLSPDGSKTGDFLPSLTEMTVHVSAVYAGATYEYDKALTLDRKAGVTVYEIVPSSASITRYKDGTLSAGTLSVSVWATSSDNSRYKIEDLAAAGLTLTQAIGYTKGNAEPQGLFYTGPITLTGNETEAVFTLSDGNSNVLDKETVPFINEGKDGEKGDKGDDGKDAITLTASPSTLLLTEGATTSTDETTKETTYTAGSFDVQGVRLSLMRGDTEVTPDDWSASDIMGGLTVSRTAQGPAFSVWVQDKDKATAKKNEPLSFTAKATYNGKEYTARVNVVLNWQGTFQETTFTDINTRVSNKVVNTINEQGLVDKTTMNSAIEQSAKGITQTVAETYETKEDSTKKYSEVKQTAEGISLAVSRSSQGRNLIKGSRLLDKTSGVRVQDGQIVSGTDGTGCNGVAFTSSDATQYPGLYWAYDKESGSRCVPVTAGKKYMLSCWAKVSVDILTPTQPQVGVAGLMLGLGLFAHKTSEGTSTNDGGDPRKEGQSEFFTVMSDGQWRLYSKVFTAAAGYGYAEATAVFNNTSGQQATMTVRQPMLEELADGDDGSVYAGWTPATADMDNALLATGIDIRNRKITLTSDKVVVLDNSGNEQALLEGGKLSTRLIDTQGLTVGGIESRYSDDKTNYAKVEIKDGVINIWGRNSPNQHIEIGYDDDGNAVLKFYDKNGNLLYNLGPNGLDAPDITEPSLEMPRMKTWSTETAMKGDWAKVTGNELKYDDFSNQTWWRYTAGRVGTDITKDTPHELTQEQATALDGWFINWNNQSTDDLSSPADTAMKGGQLSGATFYALMEKDRMGDNNLFAIYKVVGGKPTVETRDYAGNLITGNS